MKTIAVISLDIDDFQHWKQENNLKGDGLEFKNKFQINDTTYICISKIINMCNQRFDEHIETASAIYNKEYKQIIHLLEFTVKIKDKSEL